MSSSFVARRGSLTALTVFAAAVMLLVGLATGQANAANKVSGSAVITIPSAKAGKASAIAPAKGKRAGKKGVKANAPVKSLSVGATARAGLRGGIRLANGKRRVVISGLTLNVGKNRTVVRGKLGKKSLVVFNAKGRASIDSSARTVKVTGAKLSFPRGVAKKVKRQLKLKKAPTGRIGTLALNARVQSTTPVDPCVANPDADGCKPVDPCVADPNAEGCQSVITDPYLAQCSVEATSKVTGTLPAPAPLPTLVDPEAITAPASLGWGFKSSFRSYVVNIAQGSLHALAGASAIGTPPLIAGFDFNVASGQYSDNGTSTDLSDDKAVVNLTGTALFCATGHKFRVAISDPTIVIDGDNSRIVAEVDTNLTNVWTESQRIDLAKLDLSGVAQENVTEGGSTIDWGTLTASLTQAGGDAICGTGEQAACDYTAGTELDSIDLSINVASAVPATQYASQCGLTATGAESGAWPAATNLPNLADSVETTGPSTIDWGYLASFRSYVTRVSPPGGKLVALDGASHDSAQDAGTHQVPPLPLGFSFPVDEGEYSANDPADATDDQAVINGTGTGLFCKAGHFFWASISNPTIVIDGEHSRIVADISSTENGVWKQRTRVDLASLDLSNVTPTYNESGTKVTWSDIPATLNDDVAPFATYPAGTALDPVTVSLEVDDETPFPLADYCSVAQASTISAWPTAIPSPAGFADSNPASAVSTGSLDWGIRSGLRGSNMGNPIVIKNSDDVTRSNPTDMTGADKYFTWSANRGSYYSDDKLVLPLHGTVGLCSEAHGYGSVYSDPRVVIDGENSRIVADTATRVGVDWLRGTVDLVKFDATAISPTQTPVSGGTEYTWVIPDSGVTLTAAGAAVLGPLSASYSEGAAFQGFTVKATVASE